MSFGKNKSTNKSTQDSSTYLDPNIVAAQMANVNAATQRAAQPVKAFTGERVASFTPEQLATQEQARGIAGQKNTALQHAGEAARGLAGFVAPNVAAPQGYTAAIANAGQLNRSAVRDVTAGQLKDTDLTSYLNPATDALVRAGQLDLEYQRQMQRSNDLQRAQAAGAYGGDRHGVVDSLTNEATLRAAGTFAAQARAAAFDRATGLATADIDRRFSADATNQGVDLTAQTTNAGLATQASLANAAATNQARQFNSSQGLSAQLANQQAAIQGAGVQQGGAGLAAQIAQAELDDQIKRLDVGAAVGDAQRGLAQAAMDAQYQEFLRQVEAGNMSVEQLNQALAILGNPTLSKSSAVSTGNNSGFNIGLVP